MRILALPFFIGSVMFSFAVRGQDLSVEQNLWCKSKTISIVSTEYPPYQGENLKEPRAFDSLVVKAIEEAGCRVNLIYVPWSRALLGAEEGRYDAIIGVWHSKERATKLLFSDPIIGNSLVIIKNKSLKSAVQSKKNNNLLSMALVRNYAYPDSVKNMPSVSKIEYVSDDRTSVMVVAGGRVDFAVVDKSVAEYLLSHDLKELKDKVEFDSVIVGDSPMYVGFSKRKVTAAKWADALAQGLRKLESSGALPELRKDALKKSINILDFR